MKLGVVMDPINAINFKKDSSLSILLEAQFRDYELYYMEPTSLFLRQNGAQALMHSIVVKDDPQDWYQLSESIEKRLADLDMIIMRQDPPFDSNYIYNTYILEAAEREGVKVINKPSSLRDCNEKVFATEFPQCCPPFLVTSNNLLLREFIEEHIDTVVKPLDGMGGSSVFRVRRIDPNISVILENITEHAITKVMIQKYIPEITEGDKRILLIDGLPMGGAVARVPGEGELRGNLAAGATAVAKSLTYKDKWICEQIGPRLKELGLTLVGLDVIGDYLTEINVTSPTCFREYKKLCGIDVASALLDSLEGKVSQ
ncbi:MAG: glutathione synthase [Gracilimonas sp.]|jgi:glutathione synthase|uniref:glutathione synthase n=1 Tax=Gracilimonas sp. TaxID=1974203 RepID=UPI00375212F7|nr:glutathione synthase [Gracilimonas sp.]